MHFLIRNAIIAVPRALISCCAVARAQYLGQNSRFAQHAILDAQHFSPQAGENFARLFFAVGEKKIGALFFSEFAGGDFCFTGLFQYDLHLCAVPQFRFQ